ncbi:MAG: putative porin [Immundisolibacter sp.]
MRSLTAGICGGLLLAAAPAFAGNVDQKLLDMLLANGSITAAQHAELKADLAKEQAASEQASSEQVAALQDKLGWALKTQLKGDVRVRHENVSIEDLPDTKDKSRQRIRARLGAYTAINPEVDTGIRIASGNSEDARSTNQDLNNYFTKKDLWLDLAYIDYHPEAVAGLHVIGGKMKQPWTAVGDIVWDGDINPEGVAVTYGTDLGGAELFASAGYFVLKDNVDGQGVKFKHDARLYSGQIGTRIAATDDINVMLGGSLYAYDNDEDAAPGFLAANGNTTDEFRLYEAFGQVDFTGLPLPLSLYGQYVKNGAARGIDADQDQAWLVGFMTKLVGVKLDYNYRDVQRNGVVGGFTDSDFANGKVGGRGHKIKAKYDISKNFAFGVTYFMAESDVASISNDASVDTLQVDFEAKF